MIEELAQDYSSYLRVDLSKEFPVVEETIEDMLTRLDEFENLVRMVQADNAVCVEASVPTLLSHKVKIDNLCNRIDSLEQFINRVSHDLDMIEAQVEDAENDIGSSDSKIKNILRPLFFKKPSTETLPRKTPTYEAPKIFNTSDVFNLPSTAGNS